MAEHLPTPAPGTAASAALRGRFAAVGALLGVPVSVSEDAEWAVDGDGLRVGLGFYAARGHPAAEAEALALLELWAVVRFARVAPVRTRRRRSLAALRPELGPLLEAIDRAQAAAELLATLPALRGPLAAATTRRTPGDLQHLPRHLQWVAAVTVLALAPGHRPLVDPAVAGEIAALGALAGGGALRRALAPDPARSELLRFERVLALLLPGHERLLARDTAEVGRGLGEAGPAPAGPDDGADAIADGGGGGDAEGASESESELGEDADSGEATPEAENAQSMHDSQDAEGADLYSSDRVGFLGTILASPIAGAESLTAALLEQSVAGLDAPSAPPQDTPGGGAGAGEAARLGDYRGRIERHRGEIERMRALWQRVIAERVAPRPGLSRRALPEGESLDGEALASALAESLAGVPRPSAFRRRESRPRRAQNPGSTDYVLLVDRSGSMQGQAAEAAADAALIMLEGLAAAERDIAAAEAELGVALELGIRTALLVFDAEVSAVKPLAGALDDESRRRLHAEIRSPRGSTNDAAALRAAAEQLGVVPGETGAVAPDGVQRTRIVFLVGDGGSNDPAAAAAELRRLRAAGVTVFGIGMGSDDVLLRYAPTSRRVDDPARLADTLRELIEAGLPGGVR